MIGIFVILIYLLFLYYFGGFSYCNRRLNNLYNYWKRKGNIRINNRI